MVSVKNVLLIAIPFLLVFLLVAWGVAAATIWALNTVFGLYIGYGFYEILAVIVLLLVAKPSLINFKTNN